MSLHGFQTLHFICYQNGSKFWLQSNQIVPEINFSTSSSEVAVLLDWNLSRRPFLGLLDMSLIEICCFAQDWWGFDLYHVDLFLCPVFAINEWQKDWAKLWALFWLVTNSRPFHQKFHSIYIYIYRERERERERVTRHCHLFDSKTKL